MLDRAPALHGRGPYVDQARDAYSTALTLVRDDAERRLLERRVAELAGDPR